MIGVSAVTAADNNNFTADTPVMDEITTESVDNSIQTTDVSTKNTQITKNVKTVTRNPFNFNKFLAIYLVFTLAPKYS